MDQKNYVNIQEALNYSQVNITEGKDVQFENFNHKGWNFYWSKEKMFSSANLDKITEILKVNKLPDMVYGFNAFLIVNQSKDFVYEINPFEMLNFSSFKERENNLKVSVDDKSLNKIYHIPKELKVQYSDSWKNLKIDRDDIQKIVPLADWSYSSSYNGTVSNLSQHKIFNSEAKTEEYFENKNIFSEFTQEDIPINRLGRDNPVLKFFENYLYEDELNDNGLASANVRFRVMDDCFFGLLRFYLRVDNVAVRVFDTRFFHSFDQNYILREFQVRENSYTELAKKGFKTNSQWSLSHSQPDIVYEYLDKVFVVKDKISF